MTIRIDDHLLWLPDAVGCGDTPTLEVLAAVSILRKHLPALKIRVINVVDLMRLRPCAEHPHGLSETERSSPGIGRSYSIFTAIVARSMSFCTRMSNAVVIVPSSL